MQSVQSPIAPVIRGTDRRTDSGLNFEVMDTSFENFWELFNPDPEFANRRAATNLQWDLCPDAKKEAIIKALTDGKPKSSRNPYFYVQDFRVRPKQILSYADYYAKFGTTEEQGGWQRVFLPEQHKTIYVKNN